MTYGMNTEANVASFVNTVWEGALLVARDTNLATSLVTVFGDRQGLAPRAVQEYGTATINTIAETDDLTSQVFTPSTIATLTPAEYGGQFFVTDSRRESDPFNVMAEATQELGAAMAESIDKNLLGATNITALTGGTVGASGTTITWGHFYAMLARLRAGKVPMTDIAFVCHPYHWHALAKSASVAASAETNAPEWMRAEVAQSYFVQRVSGVNIFVSANVGTSSNDAYCAMFHRMALAYDVRRAPRLEPERDASRRGIELNISGMYAHGIWRPKWGIQGIFVATAPTS